MKINIDNNVLIGGSNIQIMDKNKQISYVHYICEEGDQSCGTSDPIATFLVDKIILCTFLSLRKIITM